MSSQMFSCSSSSSNHQNNNQINKSSTLANKKKSYSLDFKLEVIKYAKTTSKHEAARKFLVHRKQVQEWFQNEEKIVSLQSKKGGAERKRLPGGGRKVHYICPQIDDEVYKLVLKVQTGLMEESRPPFPPFNLETATTKVRLAEDAWNTRNATTVALAYSLDTEWRNRCEFINGRKNVEEFLERKWKKEIEYRLIKELWAFGESRIAVRFAYEWRDDSGNWFRSYGNENWQFNDVGLMIRRLASINDLPITELERKFHWPIGRRPDGYPGLSDLGL